MMEQRRLLTLALLTGLVFGSVLVGVILFTVIPAQAQSAGGDAGETEAADADDDAEGPDVPITGSALEQASAAALEYIGEGRVTETEVGDEEGFYEVEISRESGGQVDVHLDEAFNVVGHEDD